MIYFFNCIRIQWPDFWCSVFLYLGLVIGLLFAIHVYQQRSTLYMLLYWWTIPYNTCSVSYRVILVERLVTLDAGKLNNFLHHKGGSRVYWRGGDAASLDHFPPFSSEGVAAVQMAENDIVLAKKIDKWKGGLQHRKPPPNPPMYYFYRQLTQCNQSFH